MAQHNPQSRTYLVVVLVATVICFVIAQIILSSGHGDSHTATEHDGAHKTETSDGSHKETMPEGGTMHDGGEPQESGQPQEH